MSEANEKIEDCFGSIVLTTGGGRVVEEWLVEQVMMPLPVCTDIGTMAFAEGRRSMARSLLTMIKRKREGVK